MNEHCGTDWAANKETGQILFASRKCPECLQSPTVLNPLRLGDSTLLANAPPFPNERCLLEGSQAAPICPAGKNNEWMKYAGNRQDHRNKT